MSNNSWLVLQTRIEQNITRLEGRLAELRAQLEAVKNMAVNPTPTSDKGKGK